jgi:hypothetical protein
VGYQNENATVRPFPFIAWDLETVGRDDVAHLLREVEADKRLTDPVKIAADREKKRAALVDRLGLYPNSARVVALGYQTESMAEPAVLLPHESSEAEVLHSFFQLATSRTWVGFCSRTFDARILFRRAQLLGVNAPRDWRALMQPFGRSRGHIDLYDEYSFDGTRGEEKTPLPETLKVACQVFEVDVPDDDGDGGDIGALVAAGDWDGVRLHQMRDIQRTVGLARAMRLLPQAAPADVVF